MTLDDSLPLLYETLRERYRRRTSGDGVMWAIALVCLRKP